VGGGGIIKGDPGGEGLGEIGRDGAAEWWIGEKGVRTGRGAREGITISGAGGVDGC